MSSPAVEVRAPTPGDIGALAARMRAADVAECRAAGLEPLDALAASVQASARCWAVVVDGRLAAIFGVAPTGTVLAPRGSPWLLGTDEVTRRGRLLVRMARPYIRAMLHEYGRLENAVHADNVRAVRFLRALGFAVHAPVALPTGALFHPFEMT